MPPHQAARTEPAPGAPTARWTAAPARARGRGWPPPPEAGVPRAVRPPPPCGSPGWRPGLRWPARAIGAAARAAGAGSGGGRRRLGVVGHGQLERRQRALVVGLEADLAPVVAGGRLG